MTDNASVPVRQDAVGASERTRGRGHEDLVDIWKRGQRRQHTHDGVRLIVHLEDLADNVRIAAETFLPKVVAQQQDGRGTGLVFARRKQPPEERFDAEGVEEVIGNYPGL